jgi:hypothetical protein
MALPIIGQSTADGLRHNCKVLIYEWKNTLSLSKQIKETEKDHFILF